VCGGSVSISIFSRAVEFAETGFGMIENGGEDSAELLLPRDDELAVFVGGDGGTPLRRAPLGVVGDHIRGRTVFEADSADAPLAILRLGPGEEETGAECLDGGVGCVGGFVAEEVLVLEAGAVERGEDKTVVAVAFADPCGPQFAVLVEG